MEVQKTYIICATQRSGSTLLCDLLTQTDLAGSPSEYLLPRYEDSNTQKIKYHEYVHQLLLQRASSNGVSGVKLMEGTFSKVIQRLRDSLDKEYKSDMDVLSAVFPNLSFIFITRQDKLRQAVSLSRAEQSRIWEKNKASKESADRNVKLTPHCIKAAYNRVLERESFWLDFCQTNNITPYLITYEELAKDFSRKTLECLAYLGITDIEPLTIKPKLQKQSDWYTEFLIIYYKFYFAVKMFLPDLIWQMLRKSKQSIVKK